MVYLLYKILVFKQELQERYFSQLLNIQENLIKEFEKNLSNSSNQIKQNLENDINLLTKSINENTISINNIFNTTEKRFNIFNSNINKTWDKLDTQSNQLFAAQNKIEELQHIIYKKNKQIRRLKNEI